MENSFMTARSMTAMSEQQFIEHDKEVDKIESSYNEQQRAFTYGHETAEGYLYTDIKLNSLYNYWLQEVDNPIRSERSKLVCQFIADCALFELTYRSNILDSLEDLYAPQTLISEESL